MHATYTMPNMITVAIAVVEWSIGLCINLFILSLRFIMFILQRISLLFYLLLSALSPYTM